MDPDEIINSSNNVEESSAKNATNNEQQERSIIRKTISLTRKRRGTQSNGDGSNDSSTKQSITTAINQIFHRRASVSSQRPKDLITELNTNRLESTNSTQSTDPPSPITANAQPSQNQPSHSTHKQQPPLQRLLRKKSLRASNGGQYSPVSPSQSSPLSPTVEESSSYSDINNNKSNDDLTDIDSNNNFNNNNSNLINKRMHHGITSPPPANSIASSVLSPKKQFPFEIGSREQKSFQTKNDKMEKLLKKAKIFLDQKQSPKARITSLWSFTGVASEFDQAQFFQQNEEDIFDVVHKSFMSQVDKIKQKPDRSMSFTSKEFLNLNKTLLLLRKIFLFLPDRIRDGWQRKQIAEILSILLDHGNHHRIRIQGFQLLLLWINDQTMELDECIHLYSNAISLNLFLYDQVRNMDEKVYHKDNVERKSYNPFVLDQKLIQGDPRGPLFPNPHPPSYSDAVNLIQIDLGSIVRLAHVAAGSIPPSENYEFPAIESIEPDNGIAVGMGIDAAFAAAKFHFELLKKQYLVKLFPQCAKNLGLLSEDQEYGFQKCPPTILRALITFFIHHCLDNYSASDTIASYPSPATPILKSIVLAPENREFAHDIVRQSLMLPAGSPLYKDIVRGAVHIVGVWILSGEEERPVFLRKSLHNFSYSPLSQSDASTTPNSTPISAMSSTSSYSDANVYLRRYIELLNLVFEDHSFLTIDGGMTNIEVEAQVSIYRDVLSLYRSMMAEGSIELEVETWKTLLKSLLDIQKRIMNQSDKYASIPSIALADDLADYLIETILYAFARSEFQDQGLWNKLTVQMGFSVRWSQAISQWAKIMLRLTKILSKHVNQVDLDQIELQRRLLELPTSGRHHHRRKPSKNRTRHFSLKHKSSSSTSSREDFDFSPGPSKNFNEHGKVGRRTLSMHSDSNQLDTKLLSIGGHGPAASSVHSGSIASDEDENEEDEEVDFFDAHSDIGNEVKSNRSSTVFFTQPNFSNEKLSMSLANFRSPVFVNLDVLPWTAESALLVWKNMLYTLGNLNHIQIIPYHTDAIKCLINMLDMFGLVCYNQFGNAPLPPIYEFAPWLLEACDLPLAFAPGRALTYGGLCKMMSHRHHHEFDKSYYPKFYHTLLKGLLDSDRSITYAIINNSTKLFSQDFPGINILYCPFIESISSLLSEHDSKRISDVTMQNAITILCSLICFGHTRCSDVRLVLKEVLINSLSAEDSIKNYDMHNMLLYGIFTLAFDELTATTWPDKTVVKECFQELLDQLYWSNISVVSAAADCLIAFAQNSSMWSDNEEIYVMILQDVFANLIGALDEHITIQKATTKNGRGFIIAKLFYCLLEWLMAIPSSIFTDTDLCQLVFDVIDLAFEDNGAESLNYYKKVYPTPLKSQGKETSLRFKKSARKIALGVNLSSETYVHVGFENDIEDENFVKEVAECTLLHLTHHFDNFSPLYGPAMINSTLTGPLGTDTKDDECAEHYQYFSFNDRTIITVVEMSEENSKLRLLIRDMTGRYTWDTKLFYKGHFVPYSKQSSEQSNSEITKFMTLRPNIKVEPTSSEQKLLNPNSSPKIRSPNRKDKNRLPVWTENNNGEQVDMLDHLLYYINGHTPLSETSLSSPETIADGFQTEFEKELDRHIQEEILYANCSQASSWYKNIMSPRNSTNQATDNKSNRNRISERLSRNPLYSRSTSHLSLGADFSLSKAFLPVIPPEAEKLQEPYQQCRLFLSHFGWLNPDTFKDGSICMLNKGPALYRDIRLLDKKYSRECIKVALLYVGPGQDDEQSILHNMNGSKEYDEFVASLGWEIDLATHPGYLGGLERNSTTGTTSIYYCTSTLEIIFHDVTKMPTDPTDSKQLRKKRHIGNDHVHIIWNEHHREYRKSTIGGDFGNAQIIISPLSTKIDSQNTKLYSIDIHRDEKVPPFGPLLNGMVVTKNVLGPLVRMTAIHAFRASINTTYHHPYLQRSLDINMIMGKHKNSKSNNSYESFISKIFFY
ncbi:hypothetical protein C1645_776672 [Glomus cerebriforme]|uniref:Rap-GAP domain-containing protein n=1 Tax=Glomus cerebriforme TaxID=658196 RepID=A0A397SS11_9GLOM|nr:hypothetical protein C1645_776672 [Glomus cerebriforme]